ncbi:MAG: S8 family serine peptidase, partial [Actinomycetes bacterium]
GCDLSFQPDVQALRAAGIVPVFAAGNFGGGSSTSVSPANYPEALSVGAVSNTDVLYSSGSRGPSTCGGRSRVFPDIVAPGVRVVTADRYGLYQTASGTSMAAPHVSGALALLLGASPALAPGVQEDALLASAFDLGTTGPDDTYGHGRLDVRAAWNALKDEPGYRVHAMPNSVTIDAGSAVNVVVALEPVNGFTQQVTLAATGLPAAAGSVALDASTLQGSATTTLHIAIVAGAPPGVYPVTVSAVSGARRATTSVSVNVPPRDFALVATPGRRHIAAGATTAFHIGVEPFGGFSGKVRLTKSGLPPKTTATFTKSRLSVGRTSKLIVTTSQTTPPGVYRVVVRGRSGALRDRVRVTLVID